MERNTLNKFFGQVWNSEELKKDFKVKEVDPLMAPFVRVRRKTDGIEGTVIVQGRPKLFHSFRPIGDIT